MMRTRRSIPGCNHGSCCDAQVSNRTLRARERRAAAREAREQRADAA